MTLAEARPLMPPTNYYGSKVRLAKRIVRLLPEHKTYIEPFAGSLAVLFAKKPSGTEVISDLDGGVVNFFRVLRDRPDELERVCRLTPYAREEYEACDPDVPDELEAARRWWVRTNQSIGRHSRSSRGTGWAAAPNNGGKDHPAKAMALVARFLDCAERLRSVTIENRPALDVIRKFAKRPDCVIYADPPYLGSARNEKRKTYRDYCHDMLSEDAHRELAAVLGATPATVLLSGYHSPLYDELYASWDRVEYVVTRPASARPGRQGAKQTEVIWSNRPLDRQGVFDMRPADRRRDEA